MAHTVNWSDPCQTTSSFTRGERPRTTPQHRESRPAPRGHERTVNPRPHRPCRHSNRRLHRDLASSNPHLHRDTTALTPAPPPHATSGGLRPSPRRITPPRTRPPREVTPTLTPSARPPATQGRAHPSRPLERPCTPPAAARAEPAPRTTRIDRPRASTRRAGSRELAALATRGRGGQCTSAPLGQPDEPGAAAGSPPRGLRRRPVLSETAGRVPSPLVLCLSPEPVSRETARPTGSREERAAPRRDTRALVRDRDLVRIRDPAPDLDLVSRETNISESPVPLVDTPRIQPPRARPSRGAPASTERTGPARRGSAPGEQQRWPTLQGQPPSPCGHASTARRVFRTRGSPRAARARRRPSR
jgi:hypothetical protein